LFRGLLLTAALAVALIVAESCGLRFCALGIRAAYLFTTLASFAARHELETGALLLSPL